MNDFRAAMVPGEPSIIVRQFDAGFQPARPLISPARLRHGAHLFLAVSLLAFGAKSETTNTLAGSIEARALAEKIYWAGPETNSTQNGILKLSDPDGKATVIPVRIEVVMTATNWQSVYSAGSNPELAGGVVIVHVEGEPNQYFPNVKPPPAGRDALTASELTSPLAPGSDFWLCDLGLEFLRWPHQKILKRVFHRQCACVVLESTNPHPAAGGYSRVVSWIDEASLGIVEADAYDLNGEKLKNFYPKSLEKVNGRYQVESMVMENLQTKSKSVFEFDLHK
jgi:hypothetical protein